MQPWLLTHSELTAQSCAPMPAPGHAPPFAMGWHEVVAVEPVSIPQHTCPVAQSHAWMHPKVTGPEQPVAFGEQLQVPTTVPPEMPVGVKQQSFLRRSHAAVPHVGAT
jgi:hypothetical protein